ncbi:MAG TPA: MFS transporter [Polyangiales bacterium]
MHEVPSTSHAQSAQQKRLLLALGAASFMVSLDGRVVTPLLPTIAADYGTSVAHASWLVSAYMLPYGLCQLVYGPLADRYGKLRVAAHAMLAFSLGTALCGAFARFELIVLVRALTGAAAAALIPMTIAYIGDTVPYARRQATLGVLIASTGAAQALSTSAGGVFSAYVSWRDVFPVLGAAAGLATLGIYACKRHELRPASTGSVRYRDALATAGMQRLLLLVFSEGFLFMGGFSFLSGLLEQRFALGPLMIGLVLGVAGLAQLGAARLLPRLLRRFSEAELVALGGGAMALGFGLASVAPHWLFVGLASVFCGFGFSSCHSTLQTRATEAFPRARGTSLSLFAFSLFSGGALGTVCLGYLSEAGGYTLTFALVALLLAAFTLGATRLFVRPLVASPGE